MQHTCINATVDMAHEHMISSTCHMICLVCRKCECVSWRGMRWDGDGNSKRVVVWTTTWTYIRTHTQIYRPGKPAMLVVVACMSVVRCDEWAIVCGVVCGVVVLSLHCLCGVCDEWCYAWMTMRWHNGVNNAHEMNGSRLCDAMVYDRPHEHMIARQALRRCPPALRHRHHRTCSTREINGSTLRAHMHMMLWMKCVMCRGSMSCGPGQNTWTWTYISRHVIVPDFISHAPRCIEHNIHVFNLPAHTTHLLLIADIAVFGPFKKYISK